LAFKSGFLGKIAKMVQNSERRGVMGYIDKWDRIFEEFTMYYPSISRDTVDWYPSGQYEVTAKLSDGSRLAYDGLSRTMRYIGKRDSLRNVSLPEDEWRREFSRKLKKKMDQSSLKQSELAQIIGVSTQIVSRYMNGKSTPSSYTMSRIARVLGCTVSDLLDFTEE
jgi:DNA-binding XRE family transcriptional regulator